MLPDSISVPAEIGRDAALSLCLGLACAPRSREIAVHFPSAVPREITDILEMVGALAGACRQDGASLHFAAVDKPSLRMPDSANLPMDLTVAVTFLVFPALVGVTAEISGVWPAGPAADAAWKLLETAGLVLRRDERQVTATSGRSPEAVWNLDDAACADLADLPDLDDELLPLVTALAAQAAVRNGQASLPSFPARADMAVVDDFLEHLGVKREDGSLRPGSGAPTPWSSPSCAWAVALALAAFARPGLKLLNPGIVTERMPGFWQWYNSLPNPAAIRPQPVAVATQPDSGPEPEKVRPSRRRILAGYLPEDQMPESLPPVSGDMP
jgi:3-phosphoshikimate 1-carboxyvinyltransferase